MKYYLKESIFPFVYVIFMSLIALSIEIIEGLLWLKILLAILNVGFYGVVVAGIAFKDGQDAMRVRYANDLERKEIIRTGEDRPLKINEEYKSWKGFAFGFISCVPLLVLLLLHTVLYLATGSVRLGAIASLLYLTFFIFFNPNLIDSVTVSWYAYYGTLIALPIIMALTGISYILGAKKTERQQEMIKEKQRRIYGENN